MSKIRITRDIILLGVVALAGEVFEVEEGLAKELIYTNAAEITEDEVTEKEAEIAGSDVLTLEELKAKADDLGIEYAATIGAKTLAERIASKEAEIAGS